MASQEAIAVDNLTEATELVKFIPGAKITRCLPCGGSGSRNIYLGWDMKCHACKGKGWVVEVS